MEREKTILWNVVCILNNGKVLCLCVYIVISKSRAQEDKLTN